ncbi:G-D-S-L family lipolytic protein [filamentous cyanobacterium CCP5]|nr:G-D-S-L family lipolytic protein [filamentous cyanobacterium CCP5]
MTANPEPVLTAAAPRPAVVPTTLQLPRPQSGSQLFQQRWAALRAGQLYTRVAPDSFMGAWQNAATQPTYQQWESLLAQEARATQAGQGQNRLTVVVGDSLSLWLPSDWLPRDRFWLNQGISGDTTAGILRRLHLFANTRPATIHVMAGINDLKNGASDAEVVTNLKEIASRLQRQHPQAKIVIHSILPTRQPQLSSDRIRQLNQYIAYVARQQGAEFLDLQADFADAQGNLRADLTSDGLHLNPQGYRLWQQALTRI